MRAYLRRLASSCGAAMVWAVCILLIVTVLSAAVLMTSAAAYRRVLDDISRDKARLLAQSGIIYARERIALADMYNDYSWQPDSDAFEIGIMTLDTRTVYFDGERGSENRAVIGFEITESRDGEPLLRVVSSAECGGISESASAIFSYGGAGIWEFIGYTG